MSATKAIEVSHPAKFSKPIIEALAQLLDEEVGLAGGQILDPFAGVGRIHQLGAGRYTTHGVELEPEWAAAHPLTIVGDATALPFPDHSMDAVVTSPVYPNRMTDSHAAKDPCKKCSGSGYMRPDGSASIDPYNDEGAKRCPTCKGLGLSRRNTYTHRMRELTRNGDAGLHPNNSGAMTGRAYWSLSERALDEMRRVVKPEHPVILNLSNSLETKTKGGPQLETYAVERWVNLLLVKRFHLRRIVPVATQRNRQGANGDARVAHEVIVVAATPPASPQRGLL